METFQSEQFFGGCQSVRDRTAQAGTPIFSEQTKEWYRVNVNKLNKFYYNI